ncbi:DUF202 domain-containing protein [Streptomyces sp. NA04227]|uniref:DUF202 domain-containing protein n=1 Tax=Streptomyces sp. NA04227 TaxID=2742136 RepID=UPI0015907FF8|nr:DUF202 domain-containing protein [Streptomyces sp. NA04227]QKW05668.1 DUF202 domain-containing protein [Streptomyces sp. NA04227]
MTARDPGLQPERTRLAWRRTTLACTVATVLAGKAALQSGDAPGVLAGVLCVLLWLGFLWVAHRRITALGEAAVPRPLVPRLATTAALCTMALAVCGAVVVR